MTKETRLEITENAIRWASNILVEVNSNHGTVISIRANEALHKAVSALHDAQRLVRVDIFTEQEQCKSKK